MRKNNNYCVIDIETKGLSARPESFVFACLYSESETRTFMTRKGLINYLLLSKKYGYVFAHNAEFDYTCMFDNIIKYLDNGSVFVGSMFIRAEKNGVVFLNSLALLKTTVKELGKNLGIEKMELANKFKEGAKNIKVTQEDIKYCLRDCEIVYKCLEKLFEKTGGKIKNTIASCAMHIFRKDFLKRDFKHNKLNEIFRQSYYGGRVECFRFGKIKPVYKYDINSLYPKVCDIYFPDPEKIKKGILRNFQSIFKNNVYEGCALVTIKHKANHVGGLPLFKEDELIYPNGTWSGWYNFNELRNVIKLKLCKIIEVKEYYFSPRLKIYGLINYMNHFYNLKNNSTGAEKLINKFLLNALTGKFAQKEYGEKYYFETERKAIKYITAHPRQKITFHHFSEERNDCILEVFKPIKTPSVWKIPTLSSYITSAARILMLKFYLNYSENLCYTDTDSLVLDCPLPSKFIDPEKLGMFKKEEDTEIKIKGNKNYESVVDGVRKYNIRGVSKNFKMVGKNYSFLKMIKTKESLRRNINAGVFVEIIKHENKNYTKRIVLGNKNTLPLVLNEK